MWQMQKWLKSIVAFYSFFFRIYYFSASLIPTSKLKMKPLPSITKKVTKKWSWFSRWPIIFFDGVYMQSPAVRIDRPVNSQSRAVWIADVYSQSQEVCIASAVYSHSQSKLRSQQFDRGFLTMSDQLSITKLFLFINTWITYFSDILWDNNK